MPHSCGHHSVKAFLDGKSQHAIALYKRLVALVRACGPAQMAPARTRIGFQVGMILAAVNQLNDRGLDEVQSWLYEAYRVGTQEHWS